MINANILKGFQIGLDRAICQFETKSEWGIVTREEQGAEWKGFLLGFNLGHAIHDAGGSISSIKEKLVEMTLDEFICIMANNGIRFHSTTKVK